MKNLILAALIFSCTLAQAQITQTIVHETGGNTVSYPLSSLDSIVYDSLNVNMIIHKDCGTPDSYAIANVDSMSFDTSAINLSISTDIQTACDSYTWIDGNTYNSSNNIATHTLTNAEGCDSVVTLDLTINQSSSSTDLQTACDSYTWIDGNTYNINNNTATHTLTNAAGCDSIVTLDLTINTVDLSLVTTSPSITANATAATFQWLDCDSSFAAINGETSASFTATLNGNYAVEITQNGCTDTSACVSISILTCPATITDSRDSEVYAVVQIGNQCWMAENLRYDVPGNNTDTANSASPTTYGRFYDWATVMNSASTSSSNPSGVQGICPSGWHLPSDAEWTTLESAIGGTAVGTAMKSITGWNSSGNGTNTSGFNAFPAGYYYFVSFYLLGDYTYFWSSTESSSPSSAWYRTLDNVGTGVYRGSTSKASGFSCRCTKD